MAGAPCLYLSWLAGWLAAGWSGWLECLVGWPTAGWVVGWRAGWPLRKLVFKGFLGIPLRKLVFRGCWLADWLALEKGGFRRFLGSISAVKRGLGTLLGMPGAPHGSIQAAEATFGDFWSFWGHSWGALGGPGGEQKSIKWLQDGTPDAF